VRLEEIDKLKKSMILSGVEPATFLVVAFEAPIVLKNVPY
jgi:hypothetical protein